MPTRDYDVVLYGAGGFTGRQTVEYFARHAPPALRWAIAGPNRGKLDAALTQAGAAGGVDVLVANSRDQPSVDAVASRTRILLSTAGPFALYGTPVVDACVRCRTHHVNITGETWWVRDLIARYHEQAAADGTFIIPFCGFDSVPSDLGAFLVARHMRETLGVPCAEVRAYVQLRGGFSGGTVATLMHGIKTGALTAADDAFLLDPPGRRSLRQVKGSQDLAMPRYDAKIGAWIGPFFMAPVNTRVVRRSAALYAQWGEPYGPDFTYQETLKFDPPLAPMKATAVAAGSALFDAAVKWKPTRRLLERMLPKPGTGPTSKMMDRGWFTCELLGLAADGQRVRGCIRDQGDPGNRATVKFLCESAFTLALDEDALPGGRRRGGVLTPATGLGAALADRLRRASVTIEIGVPPRVGAIRDVAASRLPPDDVVAPAGHHGATRYTP